MQLGRLRVMASSVTMFLEHESDVVVGGGYPGGYGAGECEVCARSASFNNLVRQEPRWGGHGPSFYTQSMETDPP